MGRQSYALSPDRILWILAIIAGGTNTSTLPTGPWHGYLGHVHAYTDGVRFITSLYHGVMHYTTAHLRNPVREVPFRLKSTDSKRSRHTHSEQNIFCKYFYSFVNIEKILSEDTPCETKH